MKKIEIYKNGEYHYTCASKTIKEIVAQIKYYGWLYKFTPNGVIQVQYKSGDKITGKIVGEI